MIRRPCAHAGRSTWDMATDEWVCDACGARIAVRRTAKGYASRRQPRPGKADSYDVAKLAAHPEDYCHSCGGRNVSWHAPSPLWNVVMRDPATGADAYDGIVCPTCFVILAKDAGVADHFRLDAPEPLVELPTRSPDGRVWDPASDLWVEP